MKMGLALEELHRSENHLASQLLAVAERHKADHEIFHVGRDLARWSQDHVRRLVPFGKKYGVDLDPEPAGEPTVLAKVSEAVSDRLGRRSAPALLLLRDLRSIYMDASGVSADWEMVAQAAQAIRDADLLALAQDCHPENLRQAKWANSRIKESSTQILVS
jgi:hypothetical protein